MNAPNPSPIFFKQHAPAPAPPPEPVPTKTTTRYLGVLITSNGLVRSHLTQKLAKARNDFGTLQRLWSHTSISKQFKLKIFKGIFPPMVLYALHHEWLNTTNRNKLDAWHVKLLRRTIKVKTTYIDRGKTNMWVYTNTHSQPISNTLLYRQCTYYAHITRHQGTIAHSVCFAPNHQIRILNNTRVGRPREHWVPSVEYKLVSKLSDAGMQPVNRHHLHRLCSDRNNVRQAVGALRAANHREADTQGQPRLAASA